MRYVMNIHIASSSNGSLIAERNKKSGRSAALLKMPHKAVIRKGDGGSMRKVTEERACDRCDEKMYKDTGIWLGGVVTIHHVAVPYSPTPHDYDLCVKCTALLDKWMIDAT